MLFRSKRVTVFGSFHYDMTVRVPCFPRSGETVLGLEFVVGPGGKGSNQAVAAQRAGAKVQFITKVGTDSFGDYAVQTCRSICVGTAGILRDSTRPTGSAFILLDEDSRQNMIVVNSGACGQIEPEDMERVSSLLDDAEILLIQLETNLSAVEAAVRRVKAHGGLVMLNPAPAAPLSEYLYQNIDIITPNETEAETYTGIRVDSFQAAEAAAGVLRSRGVRQVVITLGARGAYVNDGASSRIVEGFLVTAIDTTGAGDAFNGAAAAAIAGGASLFEAAWAGNAAGALAVTRMGAGLAAPAKEEIDQLLKEG